MSVETVGPSEGEDFQAPQQVETPPEPKQGFWGRVFHRKKIEKETESPKIPESDDARQLREQGETYDKHEDRMDDLEKGAEPETVDEIKELLLRSSQDSWRDRQLDQIYKGERAPKIMQLVEGERGIELDEDGKVRRDALSGLKEFGTKALGTLINRKTLTSAAALATVAVATGGVSTPAILAVAGGALGRGVVEAWHSINGGERRLREARAELQAKQFCDLNKLAQECTKEGIEESEKIRIEQELLELYKKSSEELEAKQLEILGVQKTWERRRNIGQFIGGLGGLGAGIWQGFQHLSEKAMAMDINGDGIAHSVEKINGAWHYLFNSAQEASASAQVGAHAVSGGQFGAHVLNAQGGGGLDVAYGAAKNLFSDIGQVAAVFGGMAVGVLTERGRTERRVEQAFARQDEKKAIPGVAQSTAAESAPATPEDKKTEEQPKAGELWQIKDAPGFVRVDEVNSDNTINYTLLGADFSVGKTQLNQPMPIEFLLREGKRYEGEVPSDKEQPKTEEKPPKTEKSGMIPSSLESILKFAKKNELESKESYQKSIKEVMEILKKEKAIVELKKGIPTIIVPDLHARREMLSGILNKEVNGKKVFDMLKAGEINVVCLGDGMHSEKPENWGKKIVDDHLESTGGDTHKLLDSEMVRSLNMMKMIMDLKSTYPDSFHYLRGNHDEVMGDFFKFADESEDVRSWIKNKYGDEFLKEYADFEDALPLVATGKGFVTSHAAPSGAYTREEILSKDPTLSHNIRWTDNTEGIGATLLGPAVNGTLANLSEPDGVYIIGHRHVKEDQDGLFRNQYDGKLLQVNNPDTPVYGIVSPDGKPTFEKL